MNEGVGRSRGSTDSNLVAILALILFAAAGWAIVAPRFLRPG